jgi:hypothetical protein
MKGIKDLLESKRLNKKYVTETLLLKNTPGNWTCRQNVANLINGDCAPRDPYVYIALADMLDEDIKTILYRYSSMHKEIKIEELQYENW